MRLKFTDNDVLEGLMANDLTQLSADGYFITPPDTRGNTQRVFVPRSALQEMNVLAVIGRPEAHKKTRGRCASGKVVYGILTTGNYDFALSLPVYPLQSRL